MLTKINISDLVKVLGLKLKEPKLVLRKVTPKDVGWRSSFISSTKVNITKFNFN